jgi:hypothetical protein
MGLHGLLQGQLYHYINNLRKLEKAVSNAAFGEHNSTALTWKDLLTVSGSFFENTIEAQHRIDIEEVTLTVMQVSTLVNAH